MNGPAVWVRVEGKGNFLNSGNLKEFAREMVDRGYHRVVSNEPADYAEDDGRIVMRIKRGFLLNFNETLLKQGIKRISV